MKILRTANLGSNFTGSYEKKKVFFNENSDLNSTKFRFFNENLDYRIKSVFQLIRFDTDGPRV